MPGYLLQGHSCMKEIGICQRAEGSAAGRCNLNPVSTALPRQPRDSAIEPVLRRSHMEQPSGNPGASEIVLVGPRSCLIKS